MPVTLNGTTINPSNIEPELIIVGEMLEAYDGTSTLMKDEDGDGEKWRWTISWEKVPAAIRAAIITIAKLNTTFTFVDETGASYTVLPELQPFSSSIGFLVADGTIRYNIKLKIRQE